MSAELDVIIATRDRPALLQACLDSLARQSFGRFRLIVVDDGSRVPVAAALRPDALRRDSLVLLRNESPAGPAASRNRGAAAADAPHVVFLDDDVRADPELLAAHRAVLAGEPGCAVSIGALLPPPGVRLPPWDLWQADRLARDHARLARGEASPSWTHLYAGNVALRRADLDAVGGFDVAFPRQEDVELGYRLHAHGCRFVFEPRAVAWHHAEHSLAEWLRIPAASARFDVLMDRLRPDSGRLRWIQEGLRERHPLLRAARRALRSPRAGRRAERLAILAGRALYGARADRLALPAFSLAWDIEYNRALAEALSAAPEGARTQPRAAP